MPASGSSLWLALSCALVGPAVVIALIGLLVRGARRSERSRARLRAGELFRLIAAQVAGRITPGDLRRVASRAVLERHGGDHLDSAPARARGSGAIAGEERARGPGAPHPRRPRAGRKAGAGGSPPRLPAERTLAGCPAGGAQARAGARQLG